MEKRCGVGKARRLEHDTGWLTGHDPLDGGVEFPANLATDAATGQQQEILIDAFEQVVIQPQLSDLVDQNGDGLRMVGEQLPQHGGLATPQESREKVEGDRVSCRCGPVT